MREKRIAHILEMLNYHGDTFARIPLTSLQDVGQGASMLISSVLTYPVAAVLLEDDNQEPRLLASKGIDRDIHAAWHPREELIRHLWNDVEAPTILQCGKLGESIASSAFRLGLGELFLVVPLRALTDHGERRIGFVIAATPGVDHELNADLVSLDIIAAQVTAAITNCIATATLLKTNRAMKSEINERKRLEEELRKARDGLEIQVAKRTEALRQANERLQHEIDTRKRTEEQIRFMAYHDKLTGLPNRVLFRDRLDQALEHADRHDRIAAILFLDLDNFKRINDTLGHHVGDLLLKSVSDRLAGCVRKSDTVSPGPVNDSDGTVARLGGDEFLILLTELKGVPDVARVAQRMLDSLSRPHILESHEIFTSASIGIAVYPSDGKDIETLLKNGDTAMYHAKSQGKNKHQYYEQSMGIAVFERLKSENNLRKALKHGEFLLHYQPQVNIHTGKIIGMEALIRWQRPDTVLVLPGDFIPLAEETGLIIPMSDWVLRDACRQNRAWQETGLPPVRISVNFPSQYFKQQNFIETIDLILNETGLAPTYLEVEITESAFMERSEVILSTLHKLKEMGVRLTLDDFGTRYSSLSQLKHFPLDAIKIDRSFVKELPASRPDAAIVTATITMAHGLGLEVIAEGVETEEQCSYLSEQGCSAMQGFLFSRPLPAEKATAFLANITERAGFAPAMCRGTVTRHGKDLT